MSSSEVDSPLLSQPLLPGQDTSQSSPSPSQLSRYFLPFCLLFILLLFWKCCSFCLGFPSSLFIFGDQTPNPPFKSKSNVSSAVNVSLAPPATSLLSATPEWFPTLCSLTQMVYWYFHLLLPQSVGEDCIFFIVVFQFLAQCPAPKRTPENAKQ